MKEALYSAFFYPHLQLKNSLESNLPARGNPVSTLKTGGVISLLRVQKNPVKPSDGELINRVNFWPR